MIIYLSLLIALVGVVMYFIATKPQAVEVGRIMFFVGLLAFLLQLSPQSIGILGK